MKKDGIALKIVPRDVGLLPAVKRYLRYGWNGPNFRWDHKCDISEAIAVDVADLTSNDIDEYVIYRLVKYGFTEEAILEFYERKTIHASITEPGIRKIYLRVQRELEVYDHIKYSKTQRIQHDENGVITFLGFLRDMINQKHPILMEELREGAYIFHVSTHGNLNLDPIQTHRVCKKYATFNRQKIVNQITLSNMIRYAESRNKGGRYIKATRPFPWFATSYQKLVKGQNRYLWIFNRMYLLEMGYWTLNDMTLVDFRGNLIQK